MSLLDQVRARFARPPEVVRAAIAADPDERVLAWGERVDGGWTVATSRGLRVVPAEPVPDAEVPVLPWHEIGTARWTAAGSGGTFTVVPLQEVEPGVQARLPAQRHVLRDAGELPAVLKKRVDLTVVASQRHPLPTGGSVLLVARRVPGQAAREWTVVFDDDADRDDPAARAVARERLAAAVDADDPSR
ncbi:hypothetical protein [Modestobacter versicolor]|uniref:Uncharacterized protein n=1 Tax=Modestobacter versicolor TaxID=429133 RepID=A0A323VE08_9ACTN|nr:hypothetical protein [Modestobacter versicolor]MBB3675853.1 hypothetical protein [Modestobacter versicolor]PZA22831.1 hypothetical protein DMO24_02900 [Modestobacter versicolor]